MSATATTSARPGAGCVRSSACFALPSLCRLTKPCCSVQEEGWTDAAECAAYLRTTYGVRVTELPDDVQDAGPAAAQGQPVEQPVSYHAPDFSQFGDD